MGIFSVLLLGKLIHLLYKKAILTGIGTAVVKKDGSYITSRNRKIISSKSFLFIRYTDFHDRRVNLRGICSSREILVFNRTD